MGEGDRGAGSLHFFVPALRRGGCGCGCSRSGSGSHAPPGKPGRKPVPFIFCARPPGEGRLRRGRSGGEAPPHPGNRKEALRFTRPCAETDKPFRRNAAPRSEKTAGNPAKGLSAVVVSVYQASAREGSEALNELRRYRCDPRRRGRSRAPGTGQSTESKGAPAACRGGAVTARPARQPSVALRGRFRPRWSPDCPTPRWSGRRRESHRRGL